MAGADKIHLLSESLCNLVRAHEVVSNPASAVKELLDNAIDAGATDISLDIKAGGKEYIHVTDNGCGMSPIDARMAFERHATSKIRAAEDLENIQTLGFRGEGLASIATIANVVLRTRRESDDLGTEIIVKGGNFSAQNTVVTPVGTSIRMNEVYFNTPGRRRSLRKDDAEERAIDAEFTQCVLVNPNIKFSYYKAGRLYRELPAASLKERIIAVAGRSINQKLLPINYDSPNISITGFVSHPEDAVQRLQKQYIFVNGRYIKHDYFRKAIELAFEGIIPANTRPHLFVYLTVPPKYVDINIHPSKKEVRFVDEPYIWQLLKQLTKEALSAHVAIPMIDWENPTSIDIPAYEGRRETSEAPQDHEQSGGIGGGVTRRVFLGNTTPTSSFGSHSSYHSGAKASVNTYSIDWDNLADSFEATAPKEVQPVIDYGEPFAGITHTPLPYGSFQGGEFPTIGLLIYKGKYIVSSMRRSLALIDYRRAHIRVLYDQYIKALDTGNIETQELMFTETIDFSIEESSYADQVTDILREYGFVFEVEENKQTYTIKQIPSMLSSQEIDIIYTIVQNCVNAQSCDASMVRESLALAVATSRAYNYGGKLEPQQVDDLLAQLFSSSQPNEDPCGKQIIGFIGDDEIEALFP